MQEELNLSKNELDGEACIRLLLDKSQDLGLREDAADSLMWYPKKQACEALLSVILDEGEDQDLRCESAGCLGSLWAEMPYEEGELLLVPEPYRSELIRERNLASESPNRGGLP